MIEIPLSEVDREQCGLDSSQTAEKPDMSQGLQRAQSVGTIERAP
jgi:hypothetical protein